MIYINGSPITLNTISGSYPPGSVEGETLKRISSSNFAYRFDSMEQLEFELKLRKNIVHAAIALHRSRFSFETFRSSRCNPKYWERTANGGFLLNPGVSGYEAIADIYRSGHRYGTECATAIVIVYYGALVETFPEQLFNALFPRIYLMDWQNLNPTLGIRYVRRVPDFLPGDCLYIKNPDVDPLTPEFQGENIIDLGNGTYYGHGIGIQTIERFIEVLNSYRIEGSQTSAYLLDSATRPDIEGLGDEYHKYQTGSYMRFYRPAQRLSV
ncbi:MAG TPA: protein-glutamine gamma-glutamyltransferase [Clostridiaceae bacterium]|jgi:protein-glutamine gamma-glutamyltransferase|nr:protein-glutamine gamma-glutamyltransferase [Clostridiaceae bacterium]